MVKIRLMRVGKRKQPSFRVVVADARSPRDGRIIEAIGNYQPRLEPSGVEIDNERALYWLRNGAQASDQVRQLLRISGAWSEFTGEAPLGTPPAPRVKKATPAASVTETEEPESEEATPEAEPETAAEPEPDTVPKDAGPKVTAAEDIGSPPKVTAAAEDADATTEEPGS